MPCIVEFKECAECAAKPGSPQLCPSCINNMRVINEFAAHLRSEEEKPQPKMSRRKDPKQFRISQLSVNRINVDTEPSKRGEPWQDLVVSLVDEDGSYFEVKRLSVNDNSLFAGESTSVAKLTCARSWGTEGMEEDDDSVSCPICLFKGHGAGACKSRR